ncbi:hypothetical protein SNEBB_005258 [Seison nebaliae]|nr:hypothetical protein SNEBB_005258 [Seison nebaliae]
MVQSPDTHKFLKNGHKVYYAALHYSKEKPNGNFLLTDFVKELMETGIKLIFICADLPARALIKNIAQFNSYKGCKFCELRGTYINKRMNFIGSVHSTTRIRTNTSFRSQTDSMHHKGHIVLEKILYFDL